MWWLIPTIGATVIAIVVVIALFTNVFGFCDSQSNSKERAAQERCESGVLDRMASPSTTRLMNVEVAPGVLDPDVKDLFSLTLNDPLKGIDHSRITVWMVDGDVEAQTESGSVIHQGFECRAYFVDGNIADTLVLLDHRDH